MKEPSFTVGIEEEYLLVDRETRDLVVDPPAGLMADCRAALGDHVTPEFLRCQIEIGTPVCQTVGDARAALAGLRRAIAEAADGYGMAPIAASTHPFADWRIQMNTDKERYNVLARDMQVVARRLLICGMHVHVAVEDETLRFDLFNQLPYFLPHLLALSTSSPFWGGERTGLCSYRLSVFNELPRTGLPPTFSDPEEYRRAVAVLVKAGEIEDGSKLWWDLRPSVALPDPGDARHRRLYPPRRRHRRRGPVSLHRPHADAAPPRQPALARLFDLSHQREPLARPALRTVLLAGRFRQGRAGALSPISSTS